MVTQGAGQGMTVVVMLGVGGVTVVVGYALDPGMPWTCLDPGMPWSPPPCPVLHRSGLNASMP